MTFPSHRRCIFVVCLLLAPAARAAEHVTLRNGFEFNCSRQEALGPDRVRLYFAPVTAAAEANYLDVATTAIASVETVPDPPPSPAIVAAASQPTPVELRELLARSGAQHNVDAELLASVVHAESAGNIHAISRTGARGLMQLMPGTAAEMGVKDAFLADQNVEGGTRYLDALLTRYHDNIALALAAYNAGPGAVDRFHGIPPFRETRAYVTRVIREFNRRKLTLLAQGR